MEAAARHDLECVLANPDYFLRPAKCPLPPPMETPLGEACPLSAQQQISLLACLPHHTFHVGRFSVGISLAICPMFGGESSFEPLVSRSFLWIGAQIVSERQPPPHLSIWLHDMHMMGAL